MCQDAGRLVAPSCQTLPVVLREPFRGAISQALAGIHRHTQLEGNHRVSVSSATGGGLSPRA